MAQTPGEALLRDASSPHAWVVVERVESVPLPGIKALPFVKMEMKAEVVRPRALQTLPELHKLNPQLGKTLPQLEGLLKHAVVAKQFHQLYDAKVKNISGMSTTLYFDCATVLNLTDEKSGRRAVLFQSDMDVDTDGTDPVRKARLEDYDEARISRTFLPRLAYSWPNTEKAVNPFLAYPGSLLPGLKKVQALVSEEQAKDRRGTVWPKVAQVCAEQINRVETISGNEDLIKDLKQLRFPLSVEEPFVVIPGSWKYDAGDAHSLVKGCHGIVIVGSVVYPCMLADSGPPEKCGEASLRLCKAVKPDASGVLGALDALGATYFLFPGTAMKGKPDVAKMRAEAERLLGEMGGLGASAKLHDWNAEGPR